MARSKRAEKRQIEADSTYNSTIVAKLINKVMKEGKKDLAQKIVYGALENIKNDGKDPIEILGQAIENITPKMEVRPRRVGGASYMVPMEVRGTRHMALALTWLVAAARARKLGEVKVIKNKPVMLAKLTSEIIDAAQEEGSAFAKKEEMHRMAEANKAFAHFRW